MYNIETDLGRIFCKYNPETDDFDKVRFIRTIEDDGKKLYMMTNLDDYCHSHLGGSGISSYYFLNEEKFLELKKEYVALSSEGVVSISNIVSYEDKSRAIKDILITYFPNNKVSQVPDASQPYIVARQGLNNIFATMAGEERVGVAVSLDTLPAGYTLSDFMGNTRVLNSLLSHVYKTDTAEDLGTILTDEDIEKTLKDLLEHQYNYMKNTDPEFEDFEINKDTCLIGYCSTVSKFLEESDFMNELYNKLGIIRVDFEMEESKELSTSERAFCSLLLGGVRILKAVPLHFDYTINIPAIKMKYFLAVDSVSKLYIVPYTESTEEVDPQVLYDLTEETTNTLQERLRKVVKAYDSKPEKDEKFI